MKNFDEKRAERGQNEDERTFVLGGETFVAKLGIRPEALLEYETITEGTSAGETLAIIDRLILTMLDPRDDANGRYEAIRSREDDPITLADMQDLVQWLVETQTGRPTGQPGNSSGGAERPGTSSTVASSSPVAAVA